MTLPWHPHPDVWLILGSIGIAYAVAIRQLGPRSVHPIERPATRGQVICFYAGLAALWVAADWPIHDLAETYLYSVHMVQHMIISLVAPPLLLLGTPDWLLRRLLGPPGMQRVVRFVTRPVVALILFNAVIAATHIPQVVELSARSELFHFSAHVALFAAAMCMWTPVLNRLIELKTLSYPGRMIYLFLQSLVPTVPASFLTFGHGIVYAVYAEAPRIWGIDALTDQRMAGLIMKLGGGFILWGFIIYYFLKWFSVENREGIDVLQWSAMEHELNKARLEKR